MGIGVMILLYSIGKSIKGDPAPADPWDGRTMEWALPSPTPVYNFAQTPLVKGLDAFWLEKQAGKKQMTPAEPLGPIHLPSNAYLPILQGAAFFAVGLALVYRSFGLAILFGLVAAAVFLAYILEEDPGYHVMPEDPATGTEGGESTRD